MNYYRPKICLADVIRAINILKPDKDAKGNILSLLGFEPPIECFKPTTKSDIEPCDLPKPFKQEMQKKQRQRTEGKVGIYIKMGVVEVKGSFKVPILNMPEPLPSQSEDEEPLIEHLPLFDPQWIRGILTKMLSTESNEFTPDVRELIKILSLNQPIKKIPYHPSQTLSKGVQVLIDCGSGLVPFAHDQAFMLRQLRSILGKDMIDVWSFRGTPLKHSISQRLPSQSKYALPPQGRPILMLTDLGIAAPPFGIDVSSPNEWITFAGYVHKSGCPLLALIPYRQERWPDVLRDYIKMVQWDRKISVLDIVRSIY
jgi:hypothetical protein